MPKQERLIDRVFDNFALSSQSRSFFVYDIRADLARWSQGAAIYFDLPGEYVSGANALYEKLIHPDDLEAYRAGLKEVKKGEQPRYAASYRVVDKSGEYVTCDFKVFIVRDYANRPAYLAVSVVNRGRNAHLDTVTDLPNRYEFFGDVRDKKEFKKPCIALLVGTTNFVTINRLYGYAIGNRVLKTLADGIVKAAGQRAKAYRAQGAAIMLLTEDMTLDEVRALYAQMRAFARSEIAIDSTKVAVELAGGIVVLDDFAIDEHTVYTCARYALDQSAQGHGRTPVVIRNDQLGERNNTLAIISSLRASIENKCEGFYLSYQPLVSSATAMLEGVEALLRYEKPPFGKVSPSLFIPEIGRAHV